MFKRIQSYLRSFTPTCLIELDKHLLINHPLIWSTRIHRVAIFGIFWISLFSAAAHLFPVTPHDIFAPLYFANISIFASITGLGLWIYSQSNYNIRKKFGICGPLFEFKYSVVLALVFSIFISTTIVPSGIAVHKIHNSVAPDVRINCDIECKTKLSNIIPKNISKSIYRGSFSKASIERNYADEIKYYNKIIDATGADIDTYKPLTAKKIEINKKLDEAKSKRKETLDSLKKWTSIPKEHSEVFAKYQTLLTKGLTITNTEKILVAIGSLEVMPQEKKYTIYKREKDAYEKYNGLYFSDEKGNIYYQNDMKDLITTESLLAFYLKNDKATINAIIDGRIKISQNQTNEFLGILKETQRRDPPFIYSLVAELTQDSESMTWMSLAAAYIISIIIAFSILANFYGTRRFFIDSFLALSTVVVVFVAFIILDGPLKLSDSEALSIISILTFVFCIFSYAHLLTAKRSRTLTSAYWLILTIALPTSMVLLTPLCLQEYRILGGDSDFREAAVLNTIMTLAALYFTLYLPFQLKLIHRLYALPKQQ